MGAGVYLDQQVSLRLRVPEDSTLIRGAGVGVRWAEVLVGAVRCCEAMAIVVKRV